MKFKPAIEQALGELSMIIDTDEREATFQSWMERNEVVLECLGYRNVIPHPRLDTGTGERDLFIPDFMAINDVGVWEIIEIKPAKTRILTKKKSRQTLLADANKYIHQCIDYAKLFEDKGYRDGFNGKYRAECHKTPQVTLIMGRSDGLDKGTLQEVLSRNSPRVDIKTFDDVRDIMNHVLATSHEPSISEAPGVCILFSAILFQSSVDTFIFGVSKKGGRSHVQAYVRGGMLCVVLTDGRNGRSHSIQMLEEEVGGFFDRLKTFAIQVASHDQYSCIEILIDGLLVHETKLRGFEIDLTGPIELAVGFDQLEETPSYMLLGLFILLQVLPLLEERYVLRKYVPEISNDLGQRPFDEFIGYASNPRLGDPKLDGQSITAQPEAPIRDRRLPPTRLIVIDETTGKAIGYSPAPLP